ncbi:unnamed protein product [Phaeothamnion confervicola]
MTEEARGWNDHGPNRKVTPVGTIGAVGAAFTVFERNWKCDECQTENYASRQRCLRCRCRKPEGGGGFVEDPALMAALDPAGSPVSPWTEVYDAESRHVYYYHKDSGETQWERPTEMGAAPHATGWFGRGSTNPHAVPREEYDARNARWLARPARKQKEFIESTRSILEGANEYNIWYGRYEGEHWSSRLGKGEKAESRCEVDADAGHTKADRIDSKSKYFCIHFARGGCARGAECQYFHRTPLPTDDATLDQFRDCFGRERHRDQRDDMGGIGSFNDPCRTLYVGGLNRTKYQGPEALEAALWRRFGEWGEVENINVITPKSICFVRYRLRGSAEFAREAMANQPVEGGEVVNVRWAYEDQNPVAREAASQADQDAALSAMQAQGAAVLPAGSAAAAAAAANAGGAAAVGAAAADDDVGVDAGFAEPQDPSAAAAVPAPAEDSALHAMMIDAIPHPTGYRMPPPAKQPRVGADDEGMGEMVGAAAGGTVMPYPATDFQYPETAAAAATARSAGASQLSAYGSPPAPVTTNGLGSARHLGWSQSPISGLADGGGGNVLQNGLAGTFPISEAAPKLTEGSSEPLALPVVRVDAKPGTALEGTSRAVPCPASDGEAAGSGAGGAASAGSRAKAGGGTGANPDGGGSSRAGGAADGEDNDDDGEWVWREGPGPDGGSWQWQAAGHDAAQGAWEWVDDGHGSGTTVWRDAPTASMEAATAVTTTVPASETAAAVEAVAPGKAAAAGKAAEAGKAAAEATMAASKPAFEPKAMAGSKAAAGKEAARSPSASDDNKEEPTSLKERGEKRRWGNEAAAVAAGDGGDKESGATPKVRVLPRPWQAVLDPSTHAVYYYNPDKRATSREWPEADAAAGGETDAAAEEMPPPPPPPLPPSLPSQTAEGSGGGGGKRAKGSAKRRAVAKSPRADNVAGPVAPAAAADPEAAAAKAAALAAATNTPAAPPAAAWPADPYSCAAYDAAAYGYYDCYGTWQYYPVVAPAYSGWGMAEQPQQQQLAGADAELWSGGWDGCHCVSELEAAPEAAEALAAADAAAAEAAATAATSAAAATAPVLMEAAGWGEGAAGPIAAVANAVASAEENGWGDQLNIHDACAAVVASAALSAEYENYRNGGYGVASDATGAVSWPDATAMTSAARQALPAATPVVEAMGSFAAVDATWGGSAVPSSEAPAEPAHPAAAALVAGAAATVTAAAPAEDTAGEGTAVDGGGSEAAPMAVAATSQEAVFVVADDETAAPAASEADAAAIASEATTEAEEKAATTEEIEAPASALAAENGSGISAESDAVTASSAGAAALAAATAANVGVEDDAMEMDDAAESTVESAVADGGGTAAANDGAPAMQAMAETPDAEAAAESAVVEAETAGEVAASEADEAAVAVEGEDEGTDAAAEAEAEAEAAAEGEVAVEAAAAAAAAEADEAAAAAEADAAAVKVPPEAAAKGWDAAVDPASGAAYYFHEESGVTSWTLPAFP